MDIDECGYGLNSHNHSFGKVTREKRCNACSKYKHGHGGVNLLIAILGDERVGHSFSFHSICCTNGGVDLFCFYDFMLELCDWLVENCPGHEFLIMMDNLNIHKHPMIMHLMYFCRHHVVFRAPYWSCDGSIEYVFNTIQTRLQSVCIGVDHKFALVNKLNQIVGSRINSFIQTIHSSCWFPG